MNIKYCPACASESVEYDGEKLYACNSCGWTYFHNPSAAVMAVLTLNEKCLFAVRAGNPAIGKIDLPGGFVDPGETAEEAIAREINEELGLSGLEFTYLGSAFNYYEYKGTVYPTCDLIYHAKISNMPDICDESEIRELVLLDINKLDYNDISFPSVKKAIELCSGIV